MQVERPITFSTEMIRALQGGRKVQTRRLVKIGEVPWTFPLSASEIAPGMLDSCKYGKVGEILWVREKIYCLEGYNLPKKCPENFDGDLFDYSDNACDYAANFEHQEIAMLSKVISPIYMPRWCCRIELLLTEVSIERVGEISKEDAFAEGLVSKEIDGELMWGIDGLLNYRHNPITAFKYLWDGINFTYGTRFIDNPWVWVLKFEVNKNY
jgi:hypothetical protein